MRTRSNPSRRLVVEPLEDRTVPAGLLAVGSGPGTAAVVRTFDPATGAALTTLAPFGPSFTGGVKVAVGDVTGDGVPDIVAGAGPGAPGGQVKVIDGATGAEVRSFLAYATGFTGGVNVAVGDVTGDGIGDIVTGAGPGAGPHVKVFDGATGAELRSFFAYAPDFTAGVNVAVGDTTGDGLADIITGAAFLGAPHVKVFDGATGAELRSFFAYDSSFRDGVNVAAGDVTGDGIADIVTGAGAGGGSHVRAFDGATGANVLNFFAYDPAFRGGAAVGVEGGPAGRRIVTTPVSGGGPNVKLFSATGTELQSFFAFDPSLGSGLSVGGVAGAPPRVLSVTPEQPAGATVSTLLVRFVAPIDPASFTPADVTLSSSVFPDPRSLMTVTQLTPTTFRVNLGPAAAPTQLALSPTDVSADYTATIDAAGIADSTGNAGLGSAVASWSTFNPALRNLYVFRSPANANNTVMVLTTGTFPGNLTPPAFDPGRAYRINADLTGDAVADVAYEATFGPADANRVQDVTLTRVAGGVSQVVAQGRTGTTAPTGVNLPVTGGGQFRAGVADDPFFFDQGGFNTLVATGAGFPRPPGTAHDFFGPNGNTLAVVLEVPSATAFPFPANNPNKVAGFWGSADVGGVQADRTARPLTDDILIPPVPRDHLTRGDRRVEFRLAAPADDRLNAPGGFRDDMISVLTDPQGIYKRSQPDAGFFADALLPDLVMFQVGNPGGFGTLVGGAGSPGFFGTGPFAGGQVLGNGRRFPDDVVDIDFNLLTNGASPTDNVRDDNGLKVTDGSVDSVSGQTRAIAFPYIGLANLPFNGPGTGPNP